MPVPSKPSLLDLVAEFGGPSPARLSNYVRGGSLVPSGAVQNSNISVTPSGLLLTQFAGSVKEFVISVSGSRSYLNVRSQFNASFGSPTGAVLVRVIIQPGAHLHYYFNSAPALEVGAFPAGSIITIENRGTISGARGVPNSGAGGDAIRSINGVNTQIYNYGTIRPGGGAGGIGGTGGQGYYYTYSEVGQGGSLAGGTDCNAACVNWFGAGSHCRSQCYVNIDWRCADCSYTATTTNYTSGGGGGAGGYGYGCYDANGNMASATGGSAGSGGGTNAGTGGTGGTGGGAGAAGNTGNTGGSGNYTGGSGGGAGGNPGYWLRYSSGMANLALNSGTIYGSSLAS